MMRGLAGDEEEEEQSWGLHQRVRIPRLRVNLHEPVA
jgi:hypothetical protein